MANEIYTTNPKSMPNASNTSPKLIPNPERNKEVAHIVGFDNGNIGGIFATVRHNTISYEGQRYIQHRLYFLPNEADANSIITFSIDGRTSISLDFEPLNSFIDSNSNRRWLLAKTVLKNEGNITKSDFLVNDITKLQSVQNNVNTATTDIPQDILAILYNQNTDLILINDIQLRTRDLTFGGIYNIKNLDVSEPSGTLIVRTENTETRGPVAGQFTTDDVIVAFYPKINLHYTMDQANDEFNSGGKYVNYSQIFKHEMGATIEDNSNNFVYQQNYHRSSVPYTNINDIGYPESQDKSYYRYGAQRNKLFFKDEFMRVVAYERALSVISNNINTIDTPVLIKTLREMLANKNIRDTTNEDLLQGEAKNILDTYIKTYLAEDLDVDDDRLKHAGVKTSIELESEVRKPVKVIIGGVDGVSYEVGDGGLERILRAGSADSVNKDQIFNSVEFDSVRYNSFLKRYVSYVRGGEITTEVPIPSFRHFRKMRYPFNEGKRGMSFDYDNFQLNQDWVGQSFKNITFKEKVLKEEYKERSNSQLRDLVRSGIDPYDIIEITIPGPERLIPAAQNYVKTIFDALGSTVMIRTYKVELSWKNASVSASYHKVTDKASSKTKFKNKNNSTTINISGEEIDVVSLLTA